MKKLLVLALVLSMASMASAGLTLGTTATQLSPSGTAVLSITGDGATDPDQFFLGVMLDGPGSFNLNGVTVLYPGSDASVVEMYDEDIAGAVGWNPLFVSVSLNDVPSGDPPPPKAPLNGLLVDGIVFHCDGPGDVTIQLINKDGEEMSSIVIAQPEPITIGLLGLGAMFLRRRK